MFCFWIHRSLVTWRPQIAVKHCRVSKTFSTFFQASLCSAFLGNCSQIQSYRRVQQTSLLITGDLFCNPTTWSRRTALQTLISYKCSDMFEIKTPSRWKGFRFKLSIFHMNYVHKITNDEMEISLGDATIRLLHNDDIQRITWHRLQSIRANSPLSQYQVMSQLFQSVSRIVEEEIADFGLKMSFPP